MSTIVQVVVKENYELLNIINEGRISYMHLKNNYNLI